MTTTSPGSDVPAELEPVSTTTLESQKNLRAAVVSFGPALGLDLLLGASTIGTAVNALRCPSQSRVGRVLRGAAAAGSIAPWLYLLALRPWHLRWGATDEEQRQLQPGDELVPQPVVESTRAVTIAAPAAAIWPWLVQIGAGRGGLYSYDWLENLAGLEIHSADRIVPELQQLSVGDVLPLSPGGGPTVVLAEPNRALVVSMADPQGRPIFSWGFILSPRDAQTTRLIARFRLDATPRAVWGVAYALAIEIPHFVMEQKMLRGIKRRVERAQREQAEARASTPLLERVRRFNQSRFNPLVLSFAGQRGRPYAVVRHIGRRSGRAYTTPVVAMPIADGFIIPLTYGARTDWCLNVYAADHFTLQRGGLSYTVGQPELLNAAAALPLLPVARRAALKLFGIGQFLKVRQLVVEQPRAAQEAGA